MAKRILVIDDDEDILEILHILFMEEGFEAILLQKETTTQHIKILSPDLILLDVRIIGSTKTGPDICREIKAEFETMPVILLSAEIDVDQLAKGCKADAFIRKPFDINNLMKKVKEYLN